MDYPDDGYEAERASFARWWVDALAFAVIVLLCWFVIGT